MNDNDLQKISNLLDDKLTASEKKLSDSLDKKLEVSEKRLSDSLDKKLDEKLALTEKRILNEIGDFIELNLLPQFKDMAEKKDLEKLSGQIDRIERKLDTFTGQVTDHTQRLDDLESLPIIAHELRKKK